MAMVFQFDSSIDNPLFNLPVSIAGSGPHHLTVDTGASTTVLTREFADQFEIEVVGVRQAMDGSGQAREVVLGRLPRLTIGDAVVEDLSVVVADELPGCVGPGVIGADLLMRFSVEIDYARGLFRLFGRDEFLDAAPRVSSWHPVELIGIARNILLVEATVNGSAAGHFILDTGASETFITSTFADRLQVARQPAGEIETAFGSAARSRCTLTTLAVGDLRMRTAVQVFESGPDLCNPLLDRTVDGVLAARFFMPAPLVLDYGNSRIGTTAEESLALEG